MKPGIVLELPTDIHVIDEVVEHVLQECRTCCCDTHRIRLNLRVGLTEALSNAMLYGNGENPGKRIRLELSWEDCKIWVRITDEGKGFDPSLVPDPTTSDNLHKPNGRGLFLMRELLDEVHYNDEGNSVTLVLHLNEADGATPA